MKSINFQKLKKVSVFVGVLVGMILLYNLLFLPLKHHSFSHYWKKKTEKLNAKEERQQCSAFLLQVVKR
jgi:hypothetical protein